MTGEPTVLGVYDYWLHGNMHLRADRELGDIIAARFPALPAIANSAQDFRQRAARWCAERGVARFIRAGAATWLPGRNIHDAARQVIPDARAVYIIRHDDPYAIARQMLAAPGVTVVQADALYPGQVLSAEPVRTMLAEGEPAAMVLGVLHHAPTDQAAANIARYAAAAPPGSYLVLSLTAGGDPAAVAEVDRLFAPAGVRVYRHTAEDVAGWLCGLELVPPGVTDVRAVPGWDWTPGPLPPGSPGRGIGVIARVPAGYRAPS